MEKAQWSSAAHRTTPMGQCSFTTGPFSRISMENCPRRLRRSFSESIESKVTRFFSGINLNSNGAAILCFTDVYNSRVGLPKRHLRSLHRQGCRRKLTFIPVRSQSANRTEKCLHSRASVEKWNCEIQLWVSIDWLIDWPSKRLLVAWLLDCLIACGVYWSESLVHLMINWLIDWSTMGSIDWLIDWCCFGD